MSIPNGEALSLFVIVLVDKMERKRSIMRLERRCTVGDLVASIRSDACPNSTAFTVQAGASVGDITAGVDNSVTIEELHEFGLKNVCISFALAAAATEMRAVVERVNAFQRLMSAASRRDAMPDTEDGPTGKSRLLHDFREHIEQNTEARFLASECRSRSADAKKKSEAYTILKVFADVLFVLDGQ